MKPTRFDFFRDPLGDCYCDVAEAQDGDYVAASDYAALVKRFEQAVWFIRQVATDSQLDFRFAGLGQRTLRDWLIEEESRHEAGL